MHWPQIVWIVWVSMGFTVSVMKHGKPLEGKYNVLGHLLRIAIAVTLLWFGGFFSQNANAQVPQAATRYRAELTRAAHNQWGLSAPIAALAAQVHQESGWNPRAVSQVGATGMAQFMPSTASWWCNSQGISTSECQPTNPTWALRALVGYDKWLYDRVAAADELNRLAFALSAYNGGLGWVARDKQLASGKGLDKLTWFGSVERVNAGRATASWQENRAYPKRILLQLQPHYLAWGQGV
jgi:soluble lytic murein transglycosylase-like protein